MRHVPVLIAILLAGAASASAQVSDRLQVAAVARVDRVSFEGHQNARLPVTGLALSYRVLRALRLEGEITAASGESRRSYEGDFCRTGAVDGAVAVFCSAPASRFASPVISTWRPRCDGYGADRRARYLEVLSLQSAILMQEGA